MPMRSPAIADLQQMQLRLQRLSDTTYSLADQRVLREVLVDAITALQTLYPDNLTLPQRIQLLHHLSLLEEDFHTSSATKFTLTEWQNLYDSLHAAIDNTLTNEAASRP